MLLISAFFSFGILRLQTDVGYRTFMGETHPEIQKFDSFIERFGGGLPLFIVWQCGEQQPCEYFYDASSLAMARDIATQLEQHPDINSVQSPGTTSLLLPNVDGFEARHLITDEGIPKDLATLQERARIDPLWVRSLISKDARIGAIIAELKSSDSATSKRVFETLRKATAPYEAKGYSFALVGGPVEFVVAGGEIARAVFKLVPLAVVVVGMIIWLLFRSFSATIVSLIPLGIAVLWTMGTLGWLAWPQNTVTQTLPTLVVVIGVCDGIHFLGLYSSKMHSQPGENRENLLIHVADEIGMPCIITSVTTSAGLLTFASSDLESFVRYGMIASLGVMNALLLTFTLLPVLLTWIPPFQFRAGSISSAWDLALQKVINFSERWSRTILLASLAIGIIATISMLNLQVDSSSESLYGERSQVIQWTKFVKKHLRKPDTLEVGFTLPEGERFEDPTNLKVVSEFAEFVASKDTFGSHQSILNRIEWLNRIVHNDNDKFETLGATESINAQLLLLMRFEDRSLVTPWLSNDGRHLRISFESLKSSQSRMRVLMNEIDLYLAQQIPSSWQVSVTGPFSLLYYLMKEIKKTQLETFSLAAIIIFIIVTFSMRSLTWGLAAMIPTALPVVITLGTMGLLGRTLDVGTAMVAAIVLGVAVDDAVHLLSQFRIRIKQGQPHHEAIKESVLHVGRALITTSIALALGFLVLLLSPWKSIEAFGVVAAIAILAALLAVLIVLPALIFAPRPGHAKGES